MLSMRHSVLTFAFVFGGAVLYAACFLAAGIAGARGWDMLRFALGMLVFLGPSLLWARLHPAWRLPTGMRAVAVGTGLVVLCGFLLTLLVTVAHVGLEINARKVAVGIAIALPLALLAAWWAAGAWTLQHSRRTGGLTSR
jgi:hypothetical protein